jgi:CrcB protein
MAGDPSPLFATLNVAAGGAVGAAARYHLGRGVTSIAGPEAAFPWATLTVNIAGCLAMGLLMGWLGRVDGGMESQRLLLGVGLLGGFTTFSAFSLEMLQLFERGAAGLAVLYAGVSVLAGLAALTAGMAIMRGAA